MMDTKLRKYRSLDELPEPPAQMMADCERIARQYASVLKALSKY
jgi:hypothetical protein